jgi:hypothetical protein
MLTICGNIKIDQENKERSKYLLATLHSLLPIKHLCQIVLHIEDAEPNLYSIVYNFLSNNRFDFCLSRSYNSTNSNTTYGEKYVNLLQDCNGDYILNFFEDHYLMCRPVDIICLLETMNSNGVDICKTSFFQIEQNSSKTLRLSHENQCGKVFVNDEFNFKEYQRYYKSRYYIGVNFLTTKDFALRFWNRKIDARPHKYEVINYLPEYNHVCMIPNIEITASIDDPHGEEGTDLLTRKEIRFIESYKKAEQLLKMIW